MIFPIGDTQVTGGYKPIFSYAFIALNVVVWFLQLSTPGNLICDWAVIPNNITGGRELPTLITSMFMHGGWMHLIGNMLFLWVFADNIESRIGSFWFVIFYIIGGLSASLAHIGFDAFFSTEIANCCSPCLSNCSPSGTVSACPGSVPSLGASGAIAACLGAYVVMFPKSQIKMIFVLFFKTFYIPAILFLGFWFLQQFFSGVGSLGKGVAGGGVAWWAHIGGFVFGLVVGFFLRGKYGGFPKA